MAPNGTGGEGELNSEVGRRIRDFVVEELLFEDPGHPSIDEDGPLLAVLDSFGIMQLVTFLEDFGYGELRAFAPGGVDLGSVARADELPALARTHGHLNVLAVARRVSVAVP